MPDPRVPAPRRPDPPAVEVPDGVWEEALRLLGAARTAVLACHVSPDGDALGSMLALGLALAGRGVDVHCSWGDDPWEVPATYTWLPGTHLARPPGQVHARPDVLVVLDTGASQRLGQLRPVLDTATAVIVIDHHAHGSDIASAVRCVDPAAAATAVVVEELLRRLASGLDPEIATCLYVGLVTDTGSFSHSVTTPAVHRMAARLLAAGVRPDDVARRVFGTRPFAVLPVMAAALARVRFDPAALDGRGLIWTDVTAAELAAGGLSVDDTDPVLDAIRATDGADVAVLVKQDVDGAWKVSARSRGATDVGAGSAALGGGGHRLAAGFTADPELSARGPEQIVDRFAALL